MSLDAQDWVWEQSRAKGVARLVLLAVADKASGRDCSAYAGTAMLVKRTAASRRAVVYAVDKLLEAGELEVVQGRVGPNGETRYRMPKAAGHRRPPKTGAASAPGGGARTAPVGVQKVHPLGAESAPLNAVNAEGTQTERARPRTSPPTTPPAGTSTLSAIPPDWQPTIDDIRAAQQARTDDGRPVLTGQQLEAVTRKFVRRQTADRRRHANWGTYWQEWAARERPDDTPVLPLLTLAASNALWPHETPTAAPTTPIPPTFREQMARLDAITRADSRRT